MRRALFASGLAIAGFLAGCASSPQPEAKGRDVWKEVNGARLHLVDWGERGPPLILLAGLNDSARIFDELAPRLTANRHVYAFTRRGFGESEQTAGGYDRLSLAADVVGLMDALHIDRADIVGHSIAGGEMTTVAARYPERVRRLVYLDAAYDRSGIAAFASGDPAEPRSPPPNALRNMQSLIEWKHRAMRISTAALDADLRATFVVGVSGVVEPRTPMGIARQVSAGDRASPPEYRAMRAPALALYTTKDQPEQVPPEATEERRRASVDFSVANVRPWMLREKARFERETSCGTAMEVAGATHYFFLERPDDTAKMIVAFLNAAEPCSASRTAPAPGHARRIQRSASDFP